MPANNEVGPGEFSFGPGRVPKELEDAAPSQGGVYRGTTPPVTNPLAALEAELAERRAR